MIIDYAEVEKQNNFSYKNIIRAIVINGNLVYFATGRSRDLKLYCRSIFITEKKIYSVTVVLNEESDELMKESIKIVLSLDTIIKNDDFNFEENFCKLH